MSDNHGNHEDGDKDKSYDDIFINITCKSLAKYVSLVKSTSRSTMPTKTIWRRQCAVLVGKSFAVLLVNDNINDNVNDAEAIYKR